MPGVVLQAPARRQPDAAFFFLANCRFKLIPKLISLNIKLAQAVPYYEFCTVFPIIVWMGFVLWNARCRHCLIPWQGYCSNSAHLMAAGQLSGFRSQHKVATATDTAVRRRASVLYFVGMFIVFVGRSDALWWTGSIEIKMSCIHVCVCVCVCIVTYLYGQFVSSCANLFTLSLQEPHLGVNRGGTAVLSAPATHVDDHATTLGISIFRVFHDHLYRCFPNFLAWGTPWLRQTTTDPHILAHVNIEWTEDGLSDVNISHLRTAFR